MDDERKIAKEDAVLKSLVSRFELEGGVYSSEDELDLPYESNEISDDIDEMVCREQIKGAKEFFSDLALGSSDDDDDDYGGNVFKEMVALDRFNEKIENDIVLRPEVKYSDALNYFETAMDRNSKMRDMLLALKQSLLKKKQEYEDMIYALEDGDDSVVAHCLTNKDDGAVRSYPSSLGIVNNGVVVTNKTVLFASQFLPPYFKDMKKFYCPPNKDTLNREKLFPVSLSSLQPSRHWSPQSIENLENTIRKTLIEEFKNRPDFKAIYRWREYSSFVKSHSLEEVLKAKPPEYQLDWLKIAALLPPEDPRLASECLKLWDFYLCPKYSKDEWTDEEDFKIVKLVKKYDEQSWDKVAEELGTNRSPFQLFSYYQSNLRKVYHSGEKWTHEEDEFVRDVILGCTYGDFVSWRKVLYYFEKRTYSQIYNRWQNHLLGVKKGKFSEKEDRALMTGMAHGISFRDIAKALGGKRTTQQVRERIMAIIKFGRDDSLNVGDWSVQEDKSLLNLVKLHGEKWPIVAKEIGTRDRTQCRHRYQHLKKYMLADPNFNVSKINRHKRKGYRETLRSKKQYLLKLLRSSPFSQSKKKSFLSDMKEILESPVTTDSNLESYTAPTPSFKYKGLEKYFHASGSGFWSSFDHVKSSPEEIKCITDYCTLLGANLKYDLYDDNLQSDEHLKPIRDVIPCLKDDKICEASSCDLKIVAVPSTSVESNCKNVVLLPANSLTCYGFLQSIVFCSNNEKTMQKPFVPERLDTEEVMKAKELFQQRLYQLFILPALACKDVKRKKCKTYGSSQDPPLPHSSVDLN